MDGNVRSAIEFLRSAVKIYIPVYQRNYDWHIENCKLMFDDLLDLEINNNKSHFFGSIVVKPGNYSQDIIVIDGQQRLTTLSLLMLAIKNWLDKNEEKAQNVRLTSDYVLNTFLQDQYLSTPDKYILQSNPRDYKSYKLLFGNEKFHDKLSNITLNYNYLYSCIDNMKISIDQLMNSIQKLQFMVVNLNAPEDDPQLIFESLNSTGVALTDADKIRNFLLMNEEIPEQDKYFHNYWQPLEENTHFEVSKFFRYYLTIKNAEFPKISNVYNEFKNTYFDLNFNKYDLFEDLNDYSNTYKMILECNTGTKKIDMILNRFLELNVTVIRPFIMAIINDFTSDRIMEEEAIKIVEIMEKYIARRIITKTPSNALNKVIATLYRDFRHFQDKHQGQYQDSEVILYLLLKKQGSGKVPTDEELIRNFKNNDWYNINSSYRSYIFERLENHNHIESLSIYEGLKNKDYSIEHIMPQKLSSDWKKELGKDYQTIHDNYVNSLGNLTITGYNSKYSNRSFEEKQNMVKGFKESHFVNLNKLPAKSENWRETEIIERTNQLINSAIEIWSFPESTIQEVREEKELFIYDGNETFSNYKIHGFTFINDEYIPVKTWKAFFVELFKLLAKIDINPLIECTKIDTNYGFESVILKEKIKDSEEIIPGVYLFLILSNERKMNYINKFFEKYNISYDQLSLDVEYKE
ncbi:MULTISPECIES: DUF262 domain-containing protein [Staphylococcus]|nr:MULTISPECIES: DUF262 domain-containing protein [Staphylococcus]MDU9350618.1 DUF262 domain-containing protein [Staphylococcus ureilyticus]MEB7722039.1 DUF262 domain-containing HNH endonuclease family protein [Staphylococcus equorum]MEB7777093.1 DUF262 domain-containing HNH endonuclease family protein [Staphylococcus equorum]MEB7796304.1 DUF262 domain-containing HNH endonuclease family protein [Staphylococcus equorum]MEB7834033.1 DUF262 domain-containing HNH endonuclease family protein [Staph